MGVLQYLAAEAERAQAMDEEYRKLLCVLAEIKDGRLPAGRVEVNLRDKTWRIADPPPAANGDAVRAGRLAELADAIRAGRVTFPDPQPRAE